MKEKSNKIKHVRLNVLIECTRITEWIINLWKLCLKNRSETEKRLKNFSNSLLFGVEGEKHNSQENKWEGEKRYNCPNQLKFAQQKESSCFLLSNADTPQTCNKSITSGRTKRPGPSVDWPYQLYYWYSFVYWYSATQKNLLSHASIERNR